MVKTKIIETTEKYDKDGKLIEKITREETSEDDESRNYITTTPWITPNTVPCCETIGKSNATIQKGEFTY